MWLSAIVLLFKEVTVSNIITQDCPLGLGLGGSKQTVCLKWFRRTGSDFDSVIWEVQEVRITGLYSSSFDGRNRRTCLPKYKCLLVFIMFFLCRLTSKYVMLLAASTSVPQSSWTSSCPSDLTCSMLGEVNLFYYIVWNKMLNVTKTHPGCIPPQDQKNQSTVPVSLLYSNQNKNVNYSQTNIVTMQKMCFDTFQYMEYIHFGQVSLMSLICVSRSGLMERCTDLSWSTGPCWGPWREWSPSWLKTLPGNGVCVYFCV